MDDVWMIYGGNRNPPETHHKSTRIPQNQPETPEKSTGNHFEIHKNSPKTNQKSSIIFGGP